MKTPEKERPPVDAGRVDPLVRRESLGCDLTGRLVEYFGCQWIIGGQNYCGDWDVVRFRKDGGATIRCESSISAFVLPDDHPHYAKLLPPIG